jgi:hypothetical protein
VANNQTISTVLKIISAAYPQRFVVEPETVRVWASFVADMEDELLSAAVARFISSSSHAFPPTIPEIRAQAVELKREIIGIPTAFEAWSELMLAPKPRTSRLFRDGQFIEEEDYIWPHEVVEVIAKRLGWPFRFPDPDGENEMADRAHFVKAYDAEVRKMMQAETQIPQVTQFVQREQSKLLLDVSKEVNQLMDGVVARRKS